MSGTYSYTRSGYSDDYYTSPSPTPSPRPSSYMYGQQYPQRPATRAHFRGSSGRVEREGARYVEREPAPRYAERESASASARPPTASPRYTSDGHYATKSANVSARRSSLYSPSTTPPSGGDGRHSRRSSVSDVLARDSGVQRVVEIDGFYYIVPADSKPSRRSAAVGHYPSRHATDFDDWQQGGYPGYAYPREDLVDGSRTPRPSTTKRRTSVSTPQRPATTRPTSSGRTKPLKTKPPGSVTRSATEADREKHKIPPGYSIKNWDPTETPILLLGSVFHADSLGKWIYDWTVYQYPSPHPLSDMAADLWLLLIDFGGKLKSAEQTYPSVRSKRNRLIVEEYIDSGDRLSDRLSDLLKRCEEPMLRASKRTGSLGKNSGVEFVETLFGRDRELERTEKLMKAMELYLKRFTHNCHDICMNPTM